MKRSVYARDEIHKEADGSFTVNTGWHDPITGIPTIDLAKRIQDALGDAMERYAGMATTEY